MDKPQFRYFRDSDLGHLYDQLYVKCDLSTKKCVDVTFDKIETPSIYTLAHAIGCSNNPNNLFFEIKDINRMGKLANKSNKIETSTNKAASLNCICCKLPAGFYYHETNVSNLQIFCPACMSIMQELKSEVFNVVPDVNLGNLKISREQIQEQNIKSSQIINQILDSQGIFHEKLQIFIDKYSKINP